MESYWSPTLRKRISRRKAIRLTGAGVAGAAFLVACGGGSSKKPVDKDTVLAPVTNETKTAKHGGRFVAGIRGGGYVHLDPHISVIQPYGYLYSTLMRFKLGEMGPLDGTMEGDILDSWEVSPDKLQITGKISPKAGFAPIAPVNGRAVDAADVQASWNRFKEIGSYRTDLVYDTEPTAPILSLNTPDSKTVVIKLKEPFAPIFSLLASSRSGDFNIIPKEGVDQKVLDLRTNPIGSGPWMVKEWHTSSDIVYARNPNYKQDKIGDVPFLDEYQGVFITEPAVHEAQFRAGSLVYTQFFPPERVLPTKQEMDQLKMYATDVAPNVAVAWIIGKTPASPFKDVRVRQAMMMSYDKQIITEAFSGLQAYEDAGIPVTKAYQCALPSDRPWYLNPESKEFGPNVKYLKEDVAEAKKLLAAAGFANGIDTTVHYPPGYNPGLVQQITTVLGEFGRTGLIRYKVGLVDYNVEWTPKYRLIRGQIPDLALISAATGSQDPTVNLQSKFHTSGSAYFHGNDATDEDLITKALHEFDDDKRKALVLEVQRHEAEVLNMPFAASGSNGFELLWPSVRNWRVYQGDRENFRTPWLDQTKAPFNKPA